jgi:hypothetical protein
MRSDPRHWVDPSKPQLPASSFERWRITPPKRTLFVLLVILGVAVLAPLLFDVFLADRLHGPEPEVVAACDYWAEVSGDVSGDELDPDDPRTHARVARMHELASTAGDEGLERVASVTHVRLQEGLDRAFADGVEDLEARCEFLMGRWSGFRSERVPVDAD